MQRNLNETAYYRLVKVFYPSGVTEGNLFGTTTDQGRRTIEAKLQQLTKALCDGIVMRKSHFQSTYANFNSRFRFPKVDLTNRGDPLVFVTRNGDIRLDIRVVQSLFIGSLAYADRGSRQNDEFPWPLQAQQPVTSIHRLTEPQKRDVVVKALSLVEVIDQARPHSLLGDFFSAYRNREKFDHNSRFRLSEVSFKSIGLERAYWNSLKFLIAHEIGHIALGHHRKETGVSARQREFIADRFAISVLTAGEGGEAVQRAQQQLLNNFIGHYDGFVVYLAYTYDVIKFYHDQSTTVDYPSPSERLAHAMHHSRILEQEGVRSIEVELEEWRKKYEAY